MRYWIHDPSSWDGDTIDLEARDHDSAIAEVLALARAGRLKSCQDDQTVEWVSLHEEPVATIDLRPIIAEHAEQSERRRLAQVEKTERETLARLKAKFGETK